MARDRFTPKPTAAPAVEPFGSAEQAWFWFVQAYDARSQGARVVAGVADVPRPCEPLDILQTVDRLYRQRRLLIDHVRVMAHYGRRLTPPDPGRPRERRADMLWREGLGQLDPVLRRKGIVA